MARSAIDKAAALLPRPISTKREVVHEIVIFRLLLEETFQFALSVPPAFLGGGMIAADLLCPA